MREDSKSGGMKDLVKQFLYTESENTNTDREKVVEIDPRGHRTITNKAGAGPEVKNKINNHYQSEGVGREFK